jgi:hypothetical protein
MDSEIIDISNFSESLDTKWNNSGPSFGSGIELLMNDKKKENTRGSDIDIEDLNNLEFELNNLAEDTINLGRETKSSIFSDNYTSNSGSNSGSGSGSNSNSTFNVKFDDSPSIGQSTAETENSTGQTWDGYGKFNNIPMNPDKPVSQQPQMNKEELLREKFKYLRRLETLETKGITLTKKYSMDSPLAEMQGEYEMIMEEKAKSNSIKFQGNMLMACINGIEFLNGRFDPFDVKLDGWSDQINENLTDYDDVFAELYDKYKSKATMAPELKILFQLGGSAMMVHMSNTMFKSAMPGMDDILRQNPDLMRQFQSAAVNSMGQSSPGFSGFMNGIINTESNQPPPPPIATQRMSPPSDRGGNNNYNSRTSGAFSNGRQNDDGINIRENFGSSTDNDLGQNKRKEMQGPSDISDLLSRLKTKTINIQEPQQHQQQGQNHNNTNDNSTISLSELKDMQMDGNMPKRSKRRQKSDKNTVSIDI